MKLNKILVLGLVTVMTTLALVGCSTGKSNEKNESTKEKDSSSNIKIAMITDSEEGNNTFINKGALSGLNKAKNELDVDVQTLDVKKSDEISKELESLCEEKPQLIIGVGSRFANDIKSFASKYPKQQFAIVDYKYEEQPSNVTSIVFDDNISAYLAGFIAQKMTETGTVGFIGGLEGEVRLKNEAGFKAGVLEAGENARPVVTKYVDVFSNPESAKDAARDMIENDGVDVIFSATEDDGKGAIEVAKETGKKAIGFNGDQSSLDADRVLSSTIKNVDIPIYNLVNSLVTGEFKGGQVIENTLDMNAVGISSSSDKNIPPDVLESIKSILEKVKDEEIAVPEK